MKFPRTAAILRLMAVAALGACGSGTQLPAYPPDCGATACAGDAGALEHDVSPEPSTPDAGSDLSPDVPADTAADAAPDLAPDAAPVPPDAPTPEAGSGDRLDVAPGMLTIEPNAHQFMPTMIGAYDVSTFNVVNRGGAPLLGFDLYVSGTSFAIAAGTNHCAVGGTLGAGASCSLDVVFNPASRGLKIGSLVASAGGQTATASLAGAGQTPPQLAVAPQSVSFSGVVGQTSATVTITAANVGDVSTSALTVALGATDADQFIIVSNDCLAPLASGASCTVKLAFKPTSAGTKSANLTVSSPVGLMAVLSLTGTAQAASSTTIAPTSADFGAVAVGTVSAARTFVVKNNGGTATPPLTVTTSTGEFSITANTCAGATLPTGGSCSVSVVFAPATPGTKVALLTVVAGSEVVRAQLQGSAP